MQKFSAWPIALPAFLLSIAFLVLGTIGYAMSPEWLSPEEIREQAKKAVPEPEYPPAPGGKETIETVQQNICMQIPVFKGLKVQMESRCVNEPQQLRKFTGPTTEEKTAWEARVSAIRAKYEAEVEREAKRISDVQKAELKAYVKDMLQICVGILGVISTIITIIIATRNSDKEKLIGVANKAVEGAKLESETKHSM